MKWVELKRGWLTSIWNKIRFHHTHRASRNKRTHLQSPHNSRCHWMSMVCWRYHIPSENVVYLVYSTSFMYTYSLHYIYSREVYPRCCLLLWLFTFPSSWHQSHIITRQVGSEQPHPVDQRYHVLSTTGEKRKASSTHNTIPSIDFGGKRKWVCAGAGQHLFAGLFLGKWRMS